MLYVLPTYLSGSGGLFFRGTSTFTSFFIPLRDLSYQFLTVFLLAMAAFALVRLFTKVAGFSSFK